MKISKVLVGAVLTCATGLNAAPQKYQGVVSGFGDLRNDDVMDLAAVFPSLTDEQILSFDFGSIMAPNEKMSAGPASADVPGNTFVPRQRESYGWFPVTLKKERFTVMLEPGARNELFTMSFRAPFNETVDKARAKAPKNEILKLIQFDNLGFASAKDWSRERQPYQLDLGFSRPNTSRISWSRSRLDSGEGDLVLQLEETPMGRWVISDMSTDPRNTVRLQSTDWDSSKRMLLGRTKFNAENKFQGFRAWVAGVESNVTVSDLPSAMRSVSYDGGSLVSWNPGSHKGFVTLYIEESKQAKKKKEKSPLGEFLSLPDFEFPDFDDIAKEPIRTHMQEWVSVEDGNITLDAPLGEKASLALIFLGGAEMNGPELRKAEEFQVYDLK